MQCRRLSANAGNPPVEYKGVLYTYAPGKRSYLPVGHKPAHVLHIVIWEDNLGPVPRGYLVHHKDGNGANNSLDNLELRRRNWMRRGKPLREKSICKECDQPARTRGLCQRHYLQLRAKEYGGWAVMRRPKQRDG